MKKLNNLSCNFFDLFVIGRTQNNQMNEEGTRPSCKIVLLGNSGVGKTSLVTRWTTGSYQKSIKPTIGANHQRKSVTVGKNEYDLYLWDTAGQEQFQALTPLYARSAAAAIITASIDDVESFSSLQTWINLLNSACEKVPPMILAVNKIDLVDQSVYSSDEVESRFGSSFEAVFFVSAATGEGVETCFMQAAQSGVAFTKNSLTPERKLLASEKSDNKKDGCC
ncbi:small GTP-binding protein [Tritrichomonas foetus]|uniref:Small GTP-binding protein n=1 Tax=Tritrichomonas foetus TaxID=1144522 RepID=A0A1J4KAP0_9EUKA|nr:small GTP-binding protein [Tritrichomonas foetus]|eukprot:OHT08495.1 small GTP-binding protein [Tritrichomonas foetus]